MNLYLIRGLPGSGKSTFAEMLAWGLKAKHFEADMYHYEQNVYKWTPENVQVAHNWCQHSTMCAMGQGHNIVVSNTFTTEKELRPYLDLAEAYQYSATVMIIENRHGGLNIHDVPQETLDKMRNRFSVKL